MPCSRGGKDRPLHYVAAGQDLQVLRKQGSLLIRVVNMRSLLLWLTVLLMQAGDVAFEVPMSLVVTLERVLGDESVGELAADSKPIGALSFGLFIYG